MNLLIDLGNTRIKWALAEALDLRRHHGREHSGALTAALLDELWAAAPRPARIACASVLSEESNETLAGWCRRTWDRDIRFAASAPRGFGIVNGYRDATQLGVDRWMAMVGARSLVAAEFCVIDAGTALTVDVVDGAGVHRGGWILPGARLIHASLAGGTVRVKTDAGAAPAAWGTDTAGCVRGGAEALLKGALQVLSARLRDGGLEQAAILVTGGDAQRIMRLLPSAREVPNLVLLGLARMPSPDEA